MKNHFKQFVHIFLLFFCVSVFSNSFAAEDKGMSVPWLCNKKETHCYSATKFEGDLNEQGRFHTLATAQITVEKGIPVSVKSLLKYITGKVSSGDECTLKVSQISRVEPYHLLRSMVSGHTQELYYSLGVSLLCDFSPAFDAFTTVKLYEGSFSHKEHFSKYYLEMNERVLQALESRTIITILEKYKNDQFDDAEDEQFETLQIFFRKK